MKLKTIIAHIGVPAVFAACVFIYAIINSEPFSLEILASVLFGGFLFYAAPYLLWAVIVAITKASNLVAHVGFISITISLLSIASFWFSPGDPSGLPMQWLLYWPLAIILFIFVAGGTAAYLRIKVPNKANSAAAISRAADLRR